MDKVLSPMPVIIRSISGWIVALLFFIAAAWLVDALDLPAMIAAQISTGIFGLAGGLFHFLLIKLPGRRAGLKETAIVSIIWGLVFTAAVTPLYFHEGTPLRMALLQFYSFAFSGATGGALTCMVIRHVSDKKGFDIIPCAIIYSLSVGAAAVAADATGELLQETLPEVLAWSVSLILMAVIMGLGSGYSIARSFMATVPPTGAVTGQYGSGEKAGIPAISLIALVVPFLLNDFSNIYIRDWWAWMLIDYFAVKLLPFFILFRLLHRRGIDARDLGLRAQQWLPFMATFIVTAFAGLFIEINGYSLLMGMPNISPPGGMPSIQHPFFRWFDFTVGLILVGIFEEAIFRGLVHGFLSRHINRPLLITFISGIIFGAIHWSGGLHQFVMTSIMGMFFMVIYIRTRSIPAIALGHFAINFTGMAGVIPVSIFRFL